MFELYMGLGRRAVLACYMAFRNMSNVKISGLKGEFQAMVGFSQRVGVNDQGKRIINYLEREFLEIGKKILLSILAF